MISKYDRIVNKNNPYLPAGSSTSSRPARNSQGRSSSISNLSTSLVKAPPISRSSPTAKNKEIPFKMPNTEGLQGEELEKVVSEARAKRNAILRRMKGGK